MFLLTQRSVLWVIPNTIISVCGSHGFSFSCNNFYNFNAIGNGTTSI